MNEVRDRLKYIRKINGLKQKEFGDSIGIARSQIACYETGRSSIPDRTIREVSRVYGFNEEWIKYGTGEKRSISETDKKLSAALAKITLSDNLKLKRIAFNLIQLDDKYIDSLDVIINAILD